MASHGPPSGERRKSPARKATPESSRSSPRRRTAPTTAGRSMTVTRRAGRRRRKSRPHVPGPPPRSSSAATPAEVDRLGHRRAVPPGVGLHGQDELLDAGRVVLRRSSRRAVRRPIGEGRPQAPHPLLVAQQVPQVALVPWREMGPERRPEAVPPARFRRTPRATKASSRISAASGVDAAPRGDVNGGQRAAGQGLGQPQSGGQQHDPRLLVAGDDPPEEGRRASHLAFFLRQAGAQDVTQRPEAARPWPRPSDLYSSTRSAPSRVCSKPAGASEMRRRSGSTFSTRTSSCCPSRYASRGWRMPLAAPQRGNVGQPLDPLGQLDEGAERGQPGDRPLVNRPFREGRGDAQPGVLAGGQPPTG